MPRQLGASLQSERGSLSEQQESDMSLKFTAGDLTIHRLIELETTFLPVHGLFAGLTPDLLAENRQWLRDSGAIDDTDTLILCFQSYVVRTPHQKVSNFTPLFQGVLHTCRTPCVWSASCH
jgi:hypothetical protein